ncbi:MAG: hypothetical protein ACE1Y1_08280, partial [Nitrosomonadaceae bacterium]
MKTLKLLSLIIVLLGSITSGSIWAAARSGGGHGGGSDHPAVGSQLARGSHFSGGQPYAGGLQIARRGRADDGGRTRHGRGRAHRRGEPPPRCSSGCGRGRCRDGSRRGPVAPFHPELERRVTDVSL